jgi:hypothetical protein
VISFNKIPTLNNYFNRINNIAPSCIEDNKLESSNDITLTNHCSTYIQCAASFLDQSVIEVK